MSAHLRSNAFDPRFRTSLVLVLLAGFAISSAACGPPLRRVMPPALAAAHGAIVYADEVAVVLANDVAQENALVEAVDRVDMASNLIDPNEPEMLRTAFLRHVEAGNLQSAANILEVWQPESEDVEAYVAIISLATLAQDYEQARELAWDCVEYFEDDRSTFMSLWYDAYASDEVFLPPEVLTVVPGEHLDDLEALGGGSTITLRFNLEGETIGAFKPMQNRRQSNYRAEIAAYRLCP